MDGPNSNGTKREGRDEAGRFAPGNPGGGRPKGSRHKIEEVFLADLHAKWVEQGASAIDRMIESHPNEFVRVVANVLPKEAVIRTEPLDDLSDDELIERTRSLLTKFGAVLGLGAALGNAGPQASAEQACAVQTVQ